MGKKPTKTASWRTLMRRAETAAPAEAKRLRDRAAAMRRDERKAAAAPKRAVAKKGPPSAGKVRKVARKKPLSKADLAKAKRSTTELMNSMPPKVEARHFGANEAVPAGMSQEMAAASREERRNQEKAEQFAVHVRAIMTDARKRKGGEGEKAIADRIRNMIGIAVHEASEHDAKINRKHILNQRNAHTAQVVRAFLASMDSYQHHNIGGIPAVLTMSGYTIARIIDALNAAGWSSEETPDAFYEHI